MSRLFAFLMITLGSLFALAGLAELGALAAGDEPVYAEISIAALESRGAGEAEWIRVPDGMLYWPASVLSSERNLSGTKREDKGYYVPLVSRELAGALDDQLFGGKELDLHRVRALVFVSKEDTDRDFPWMDPDSKAPARTGEAYEVRGRVKPGRATPLHVEEYLAEHRPSLDPARGVLIEHGEPAHTWSGAAGAGVLALLFLAAGLSRLRRRRDEASAAGPQEARFLVRAPAAAG